MIEGLWSEKKWSLATNSDFVIFPTQMSTHRFSLLLKSHLNFWGRVDFEVLQCLGLWFYRYNSLMHFWSFLYVYFSTFKCLLVAFAGFKKWLTKFSSIFVRELKTFKSIVYLSTYQIRCTPLLTYAKSAILHIRPTSTWFCIC